MSLPSPIGLIPDAIAAPSPPLDPPAVTFGSQGFRVRPWSCEWVCTRSPKSGRLVRANGIAPAPRIRSTVGASIDAIASARAVTPLVVGVPATSMFSFTVHGTPWNTPSSSPRATAASAASAAALASSLRSRTIALRWPFTCSTRVEVGVEHLAARHLLRADLLRQFPCSQLPE
jgi:hypothetical protein